MTSYALHLSALTLVTILSAFSVTGQRSSTPIGGDLTSSIKIAVRLCNHPWYHTEDVAQRFYDCYRQVAGTEQFAMCQQKNFGGCLDNLRTIDAFCKSPQLVMIFGSYMTCVQGSFQKARIDVASSVTGLNVCQGNVLGF